MHSKSPSCAAHDWSQRWTSKTVRVLVVKPEVPIHAAITRGGRKMPFVRMRPPAWSPPAPLPSIRVARPTSVCRNFDARTLAPSGSCVQLRARLDGAADAVSSAIIQGQAPKTRQRAVTPLTTVEVDVALLTPMMAHYVESKRMNPTYLLLYRVGDFYEVGLHRRLALIHLCALGSDSGTDIRSPAHSVFSRMLLLSQKSQILL
jgi:hypothetical protein